MISIVFDTNDFISKIYFKKITSISTNINVTKNNINRWGRSSSLVGYGIGIAEVVGSNPTRSISFLYAF